MPQKRLSTKKRFFKGMKSLLLFHNHNSDTTPIPEEYTKEGVAVTLTTEYNYQKNQEMTLLNNTSVNFIPSQPISSSCLVDQNNHKAFIHYEPKKQQITLGGTNNKKSPLILSIDQFSWLISQLKEEQLVYSYKILPMLGIVSTTTHTSAVTNTTITMWGKRLIIKILHHQKKKQRIIERQQQQQQQLLFMIPKALLLQASNYIPQTKPLPPHPPMKLADTHKLDLLNKELKQELKRYCLYTTFTQHELFTVETSTIEKELSPPSSVLLEEKEVNLIQLQCAEQNCTAASVHLFTLKQSDQIMFPISFTQQQHVVLLKELQLMNKQFTSSAIPPTKYKSRFDSLKLNTHAISAFQYMPPGRADSFDSTNNSSISSISQVILDDDDDDLLEEIEEQEITKQEEEYGYVAVDKENEEILIVFPNGVNQLSKVSTTAVPWFEIDSPTSSLSMLFVEDNNQVPYVLESALIAWRRCEMKVVTLLMRLCSVLPAHYKVVIMGYALGGAVAALCASSLRSTRLLTNRPIIVCGIESPRVGNPAFLSSLSAQGVETIRISHYQDQLAHFPPRTSGLLHLGDVTVILDSESDYMVHKSTAKETEDFIDKSMQLRDQIITNNTSNIWHIPLLVNGCCY